MLGYYCLQNTQGNTTFSTATCERERSGISQTREDIRRLALRLGLGLRVGLGFKLGLLSSKRVAFPGLRRKHGSHSFFLMLGARTDNHNPLRPNLALCWYRYLEYSTVVPWSFLSFHPFF